MLEEQPKWTVTEGRRGPVAANRSLISRSCGRMRQKTTPKAQRRRERPSNGDWLKEQSGRKRWQSTLTFPPIFIAGNPKTGKAGLGSLQRRVREPRNSLRVGLGGGVAI